MFKSNQKIKTIVLFLQNICILKTVAEQKENFIFVHTTAIFYEGKYV